MSPTFLPRGIVYIIDRLQTVHVYIEVVNFVLAHTRELV